MDNFVEAAGESNLILSKTAPLMEGKIKVKLKTIEISYSFEFKLSFTPYYHVIIVDDFSFLFTHARLSRI